MKRKRISVRRRKALRRILIAAAALFVVNHVFLVGLLFPIQAIHRNEERMGTGRTATVCRDWTPELRWSHLVYLTENENVTLLSGAYLDWLGWTDGFGVPVDCSKEAPMHGGYWYLNHDDTQVLYIFGRVDDPAIVRIKVVGEYVDFQETDLPAKEMQMELASEAADWMEKDGRRYFLFKTVNYGKNTWGYFDPEVIGYDKYYYEVARMNINEAASTIYN